MNHGHIRTDNKNIEHFIYEDIYEISYWFGSLYQECEEVNIVLKLILNVDLIEGSM